MKIVYKGPIFTIARKKVRFDDGHTSVFDLVFHKPAVAVVPYFPESDSIIMVRQPRFAVSRKLWEIPAGLVEKSERPLAAAKRELEEEIGYRPGKIVRLKTVFSSPGFTDETTWLYLAWDLAKTRTRHEKDEQIEIRKFKVSGLLKGFLRPGECDAKSILAVLLAVEKFRQPGFPPGSGKKRR